MQLIDLYDRATPEVKQWMHENIGEWNEFFPYNYTLNNPLYFIDPDALRSAADVFHLMR